MTATDLAKPFVFLVAAGLWIAFPARVAAADVALRAAQACWIEAEMSEADCTAILHVLRARAGRMPGAFAQLLWSYSALKADTPRARFARALPADDYHAWNAATNALWRRLRAIAAGVLSGTEPNPCPRARHWGAPDIESDVRNALGQITAGRWRVARCRKPTANIFYEIILGRDGDPDPQDLAEQLLRLRARLPAELAAGSYQDPTRADRRAP